ncbi:hypothetical protein RHOSPDRAFT_37456 [Rhodotorula sp. JG-1b]|nr:hypothetical protein RHOSPDRAFT_37456 [Rhodotorula sp. JG-1b]
MSNDAPKRPSRLSAIIKSTGADFRALDKHVAAVGTLKAGYNNFYKGSQGVFQSCERIWFEFLVHYQCIYVKAFPTRVDPTVIGRIHPLDAQSDISLEEKVNSGPTTVKLVVAAQSSVNDLFHACAAYLTFKLDSATGVGQSTVHARTFAAWVTDLTSMLRACSDAASKDLGHIAGSAAVQSSLHQQLQAWTRSTVLQRNLNRTQDGGRFYGAVEVQGHRSQLDARAGLLRASVGS